jgi:hypothetical protein
MSLIHEHHELKQTIAAAQERLAVIEADPEFARDKEFEDKLRALLGDYHRSLRDIVNLLDPESRRPAAFRTAEPKNRRPRQVTRYTNPHDNTVVESKGGNHRTLKEWNEKYGKDVVKSWGKAL